MTGPQESFDTGLLASERRRLYSPSTTGVIEQLERRIAELERVLREIEEIGNDTNGWSVHAGARMGMRNRAHNALGRWP